MGVTFICFGMIDQLQDPDGVLKLSLLLRFMQGTAQAMVLTTIYSIITNLYPNRKE